MRWSNPLLLITLSITLSLSFACDSDSGSGSEEPAADGGVENSVCGRQCNNARETCVVNYDGQCNVIGSRCVETGCAAGSCTSDCDAELCAGGSPSLTCSAPACDGQIAGDFACYGP